MIETTNDIMGCGVRWKVRMARSGESVFFVMQAIGKEIQDTTLRHNLK
jgi:hypothetical protein